VVSFGEVRSVNLSKARRGGLLCAVLILYALTFHLLFLFAGVFEVSASNASIWYPPAGLRLAILLIFGWRFGVLIFCAETMRGLASGIGGAWGITGAGASDLLLIASLLTSFAIPPACYVLATFFLERRKRLKAGGDPFTGILHFLFVVCLAAAATSILICLNLGINGFLSWSEFRAAAGGHAIGDVIGILTLTPALLLAASRFKHRWMAFTSLPADMGWVRNSRLAAGNTTATRTLREGAAVCLLTFAAFLAAGEHSGHSSAAPWYPFLLPVIWLALRFGLPAAIVGTCCMNVAAALAAALFSDVQTFQDVQIFMVALSVSGLLMGNVVSELHNEKATLELRVRARTRDLLDEIDRRKDAEHSALREKQRAESYLAIAQPVIIAVDRDARITLVNNSAVRLLGERREDLLGRDWIDLVAAPEERSALRLTHRTLIAGGAPEVSTFETRMRAQGGNLRVIDWRCALIRNDREQIVGILCSGDDITERIAAEEKLRYLASYDPVTGLNNRNWLLDHFPRATARSRRHNKLLAILFIDLSGFKQINDVYGHAHGDSILFATAGRLKQCVRETDAVTRLGGDEFVVLLEDVAEPPIAVRIAEAMLRAIAEPLRLGDDAVAVGASIGIAFYPYDGKTAEELLSRADAAMYRAKRDQSHGYRMAPGAWTVSRAEEPNRSRTNG
jgi:diguanylate cyclase (GGDEF)-like protein/PAS domain S-box-containing protein